MLRPNTATPRPHAQERCSQKPNASTMAADADHQFRHADQAGEHGVTGGAEQEAQLGDAQERQPRHDRGGAQAGREQRQYHDRELSVLHIQTSGDRAFSVARLLIGAGR